MINNINLPDDIINYITKFLIKCEVCRCFYDKNNLKECAICNRSWCNKCAKSKSAEYIRYEYFEVYILTCKSCLADLRKPKYINI